MRANNVQAKPKTEIVENPLIVGKIASARLAREIFESHPHRKHEFFGQLCRNANREQKVRRQGLAKIFLIRQ